MSKAQRIVARVFAAFLWLVAFGSLTGPYAGGWTALTALLAGMGLVLWSLQPKADS
jgi:hypothetical protein